MDEEADFNKNADIIIQYIDGEGSLPDRAYRRSALELLQKYIALAKPQHWHEAAHEGAVTLSNWLRRKKKTH